MSAPVSTGASRPVACSRAVRHAWLLARQHGHHWASSADPEALAYGRAILRGVGVDQAKAAYQAALGWLTDDEIRELAAAGRLSLSALTRPALRTEPIPPRTEEEALALSALPSGIIGGIGFDLGHVTGTGRLGWEVHPRTGAVEVTVYRPGNRVCLRLAISGDLRRVIVDVGPAPCRSRHVWAANDCLAALGLPTIAPGDAIVADQDGRTPAWWDAVEGAGDEEPRW